jgi:hypothetical protein
MLGEQSFEGRRENLSQANKLSRTFTTMLEALNRHRGQQRPPDPETEAGRKAGTAEKVDQQKARRIRLLCA